ncbi:MAG: response regulator transcription factor [Ignavibacteriales bacterium]|nr:response regulator transcription factor [Ignavibacteriales bacterium]
MKTKQIRLMLADDHPVVISGVKNSLADARQIQVIGEITDGAQVISAVQKLRPDILLLDIAMPGMNGLEITRKLAKAAPQVKVIAFTMHDDREYVLEVVHAGARGYVLKETSTSELIRAIETVFNGETFFSESVGKVLLNEQFGAKPGTKMPTLSQLSHRENQILRLLADGLSNKLIAAKLKVSVRTIQTHRQHIMKKLGVHTVVELVRFAITRGLSDIQHIK